MKNYRTIKKNGESLTIIEKSKFIGYAFPVKTEEEAQEKIKLIKKKHYDATHNVWAYVIGDDMSIQRYSDDGEPSGTAGIPTLDIMRKKEITDTCIVVTRYFGGIKLGAGGLVRAYSKSAKTAVEDAEVIEYKVHSICAIEVEYTLSGKVTQELKDTNRLIQDITYLEKVNYYVALKPDEVNEFKERIIDLCNGKCIIEDMGEELIAIEVKEETENE